MIHPFIPSHPVTKPTEPGKCQHGRLGSCYWTVSESQLPFALSADRSSRLQTPHASCLPLGGGTIPDPLFRKGTIRLA